MQEELFNKVFKDKYSSLNYSINSIQNNAKIQKSIKEEKISMDIKRPKIFN